MGVVSRPMTYLYLAVAILAEVAATTFMKMSDGFTRPIPSVLTVLGYGVAFFFLSIALKSIHTGIAYVLMFSAYPQLRTTIIGVLAFIFPLVSILVDRLAFGKTLQPAQWVGLIMIIFGTLGAQMALQPRFRKR